MYNPCGDENLRVPSLGTKRGREPRAGRHTAWASLACHLNCLGGICLHKVLASASREINSTISTIVPQYIKEATNHHKNQVLRAVKAQICRLQSPFPCDSASPTRAHEQKASLTPSSEQKPSSQVVATRMDLSGATLAGLSSCWLSLRTRTKHDPHCSLPQALVGAALGQRTEQLGTRKNFKERGGGCRALPNRQGEMGCNALHGLVSILRSLWAS